MQQSHPLLLILLLVMSTTCALAQQNHDDTLVLHFDFSQYTLRPGDAGRLDQFLQYRVAKADSLSIIGYTDTTGSTRYNNLLSLSRARVVARYITNHLPTHARQQITGRGEDTQIAGGDSLNRRVLLIAAIRAPKLSDSISAATKPDTTIVLSNIYFIEDTPIPTASSRMTLPDYVCVLRQYKTNFLEIDGYCNSATPITKTSDPLFQLSIKRAKFIFDYLVDEGFDPDRMSYKGMGNSAPKNAHPATAGEARDNMRVEVRIFSHPIRPPFFNR